MSVKSTLNNVLPEQGRRSHLKSEGAQGGGYFFSCIFLLHFWAIWKNDPFSKSQKVGGLKPGPPCPSLYAAPDYIHYAKELL